MLKKNRKRITKRHVRLVMIIRIKHGINLKPAVVQKPLLFKRIKGFKTIMSDETNYTI